MQLLNLPQIVKNQKLKIKAVRAVKPSLRTERWYKAELLGLVKSLRNEVESVLRNPPFLSPAFIGDDDKTKEIRAALEAKLNEILARKMEQMAQRTAQGFVQRGRAQNEQEVAEQIHRAVGVDVKSYLTGNSKVDEKLALFTKENTRLIGSIPQQYLDKVQQAVADSALRGGNTRDLADKIRQIGGATESRAKLIARDQTAKFNSSLTQAQHESMGITHYRWSTSKDERVRDSHAENEGKIFAWDDPPDTGHPGHEINCRCVSLPVLDVAEVQKARIEQGTVEQVEKEQTATVNDFLDAVRGGKISDHFKPDSEEKAVIKQFGLTNAEAAAIKIYTRQFYQDINYFYHHPEAQESGQFKQVKAMADLLDKTLDKLPKRAGVMHRYTWFNDKILKQHQIGNVVTYDAFTSTSHTGPVKQFKDAANVYLIITSKNGRLIESLSSADKEREVLFKRGSKFKVEDVIVKNEMTEIYLKEE